MPHAGNYEAGGFLQHWKVPIPLYLLLYFIFPSTLAFHLKYFNARPDHIPGNAIGQVLSAAFIGCLY